MEGSVSNARRLGFSRELADVIEECRVLLCVNMPPLMGTNDQPIPIEAGRGDPKE